MRQLVRRLSEESPRCRFDAVAAAAEIDLVEIHLEYLVLRVGSLDPEREERLLDLAGKCFLLGQEEIARELRRGVEVTKSERWSPASLPWLAVPFLILLGFALMIVGRNPANPGFSLRVDVWDRYVLQSVSWISLDSVARQAETAFYHDGVYPESADQLTKDYPGAVPLDPWGRPYRLVTRGGKLLVTGSDSGGQPIQSLILSRHLAWEGAGDRSERPDGPGVQLVP